MGAAGQHNGNSQPDRLLRVLGTGTLTLYGMGDMLGAGIYGLVGRAAGQVGNAVWMAFLISMLAAMCTGLSYAEAGSRYPKAAGSAYVAQLAFGSPLLSYVTGLATLASGLTSMGAAAHIFAGYLGGAVEAATWHLAIATGFVLVLALINLWGIRQSIWVNVVCTLIEVSGLLLVIAVGMRFWGSVNYLEIPETTAFGTAATLGPALILQGAVLTFYSFVGFEDMLNVSEEVRDPRRTFPRALVLALVLTALLYMAIGITAVSVVPHAELARSEEPLVDVVKTAAPWFPTRLFSLIAIVAVTNTALLNFLMGSRLLYGMAHQRLLPYALGKVDAKRKTPYVAIFTVLVLVTILVLVGDVAALAKATSVLLLLVFVVVNGAILVLRKQPGHATGFRAPRTTVVLGITICVAMLLNAQLAELVVAGALIGVILILYVLLRPWRFL